MLRQLNISRYHHPIKTRSILALSHKKFRYGIPAIIILQLLIIIIIFYYAQTNQ